MFRLSPSKRDWGSSVARALSAPPSATTTKAQIGIFLVMLGIVMISIDMISNTATNRGLGITFLGACTALAGVCLLVWAKYDLRVFAEPIVAASQDKVRVGEEFEVTFQQRLRREILVRRVAVRLIFREIAVSSGYFDVPNTRDETAQEIELRTVRGPILSGQATLRVPDDAMHSFRGEKNRLEWLIAVQVDRARGLGFKEEYEITVLPERVA